MKIQGTTELIVIKSKKKLNFKTSMTVPDGIKEIKAHDSGKSYPRS